MIKILLRSTLVVLALLILFLIFLLSSSGLRFGLWLGKAFLPGELHYQSASGLITGPIELKGIDYRDKNLEVRIDELKFNWNLWALLIKKLSLQELKASRIVIIHHSPDTRKIPPLDFKDFYEKNPFRAYTQKIYTTAQAYKNFLQHFHFTWSLSIDNAKLGPVIYYSNNQRVFELSALRIQGRLSKKKINFSIGTAMIFPYSAEFQTQIVGDAGNYKLGFSVRGKNIDFSIAGAGNRHGITLSASKTEFFKGQIQGSFHLDWEKDLTWSTQFSAKNLFLDKADPKQSIEVFEANISSDGKLNREDSEFALLAKIKTKNSNINLDIQHRKAWLARWDISLAKGKYQSQGSLTGAFENPYTAGNLKIQNFTYSNYSAAELTTQWKLSLNKNSPLELEISANQFISPTFSAPKLALRISGTFIQHQIAIMADFDDSDEQILLSGSLQGNSWEAKVLSWEWGDFHLPSSDNIQLQINLPDYRSGFPNLKNRIDLSLQTNLSNLDFISDLFPDIRVTGGKIAGNFHLTGTLQKPILNGEMNFLNGKVLLPQLDLTLNDASIHSNEIGPVIHYTAHAIAGKDPVTIVGETDLTKPGKPSTFKITGNNILLVDTPEYTIYGTPDVTASFVGTQLNLSGTVFIPSGVIRPHDFRNVTQLPANEITFVGTPKVVGASPWQTNMNLKIIAGEHLVVDSFGIHGLLDGTVQLIQPPNQTLLANGKIGIHHGSYRAYGHELKISHGSFMQFTNSPITNPTLSIEATRKINASTGAQIQSFATEAIVVGMDIHGPLKNPDINLFSSSGDLSQSDILAYILTGATTNNGLFSAPNNTNSHGSFAYTANLLDAAKLGGAGVGNTAGLIAKIQSGLGFSELGFESDTTFDAIGNPLGNQTNFVVGRHLSRDFYIRYSRGIYGPGLAQENKITLRYLFRQHWAIQLETSELGNGSDTGADILYTTERK